MCVTLWQDFIGAAFLASLAPPAPAPAPAAATGKVGAVERRRRWTLDLHSAAATSKPSPYLPVCVVATATQPSPGELGGGGRGERGELGRRGKRRR